MKVITQDAVAKYIFEDETQITMLDNMILTPDFNIGDLNTDNTVLHTGINNVPNDFWGCKYHFDGSDWTEVEGWDGEDI